MEQEQEKEIKQDAEASASAKRKHYINGVFYVNKLNKLYCYRITNKYSLKFNRLINTREMKYTLYKSRDYSFYNIRYENGADIGKLQRINKKYGLTYKYFKGASTFNKNANKESKATTI